MTDAAEARAREIADNWYEAELDRDNGTTITVGAGLRLCEAIAVALRSRPSRPGYRAALEAAAHEIDWYIDQYKSAIIDWKTGGTSAEEFLRNIQAVIRALAVPEEAGMELETTAEERAEWLRRAEREVPMRWNNSYAPNPDVVCRLIRDFDRLLASRAKR